MPSALPRILAAVALGGAALWATHRRAKGRAEAAHAAFPAQGRMVTVRGRRVHAVQAGEGPDLVLIHGASGNLRDLTFDLLPRLAPRFRVTAFDRPGLGWTDGAPGRAFTSAAESPQDQAALLRDAARALGIRRPILLGHSFGGIVALAWAVAHPAEVCAVVSLAGVAMPWSEPMSLFYKVNGSALGGTLATPFIAAYAGPRAVHAALRGIFHPDPVPEGYAEAVGTPLTLRLDQLRANARQVRSLLPHVRALARAYPALTVPVEIVHGDADTIVPIAIHSLPLLDVLPTARLTVLPGVGHMPHHAAPEAVVAAVDRAASRCREAPPPP